MSEIENQISRIVIARRFACRALLANRFSGLSLGEMKASAAVCKALFALAVCTLLSLQALKMSTAQAQSGIDSARTDLMVSQLVLGQRNIHFGQGSRLLDERENSVIRNSAFADLDDIHSRTDSVFKQRIRAELDFYGLVGSSLSDDDFLQDSEDWSASVVLRIPVTALDLYGKFGAIHQTNGSAGFVDSQRYAPNTGTGFRPWARTEGFASIGAELKLGFFNLFGEYMRIDSESERQTDTFSTGIKVRF